MLTFQPETRVSALGPSKDCQLIVGFSACGSLALNSTKYSVTAGIKGDVGPSRGFSGSAARDDQRDVIRLFGRTEVLYGRHQGVKQ
jgi:hypothetical protein